LNRSVIYELRQDYQAALRDVTQAVIIVRHLMITIKERCYIPN
jgi:hypothetical protein